MRSVIVPALAALTLTTACQKLQETALEKATGGKVKIDGDKVTIEGEDGSKAVIDGKKATFKGADGTEGKIEADGDRVNIVGADGTKAVIGAQELPKDFPLELYSGSKIQASTSAESPTGERTFMISSSAKADVPTLAAHYQKQLEQKGLKLTRTEQNLGEMQLVVLAGKTDAIEAAVQITDTKGQEERIVAIQWRGKR